jgi:SAM-dependent methyltransferase
MCRINGKEECAKLSPRDEMYAANNQPRAFAGVWQIFLYNWHFYAVTLGLVLGAVLLMRFSRPTGIRLAIGAVAAVATFWAFSSLLVSHYVYDRSRLSQWNWLTAVLKKNPGNWVNVHAGLDQTSDSLMRMFPAAGHRILDIYVPSEMSEPSIYRARRYARAALPSETANPLVLPIENCACDTIFLIFVAHELRRRESRLQFFREVWRALKPMGCVVLVEHLRDWRNFLAYGPGVLHFFSRRDWLLVSSHAGFSVAQEVGVTPFVRCFVLTKPSLDSTIDSLPSGNAS